MFNRSISPRFQGVQNCIQPQRQQVAIGRPSPVDGQPTLVDVGIISGGWTQEKAPKSSRTTIIHLPDGDTAYFREKALPPSSEFKDLLKVPYGELFLHDRGASVLNDQLGFQVIPKTDLVDLQEEVPRGTKHHYGAIRDEVKGQNLSNMNFEVLLKRYPVSFEGPLNAFSRSMLELYLYTIVAHDADKSGHNIMFLHESGEFKSIDNECSGSSHCLQFPYALNQFFQGQLIPVEYQEKLQQFVVKRNEYRQELLPYYDEETIQGMFDRAQALLDNPYMQPIDRTI